MAGQVLLLTLLTFFGPNEVGTTALPLLKVPVSPRACALGEAYVALGAEVGTLFWNPAGLGRINATQLGVSHHEWPLATRDENLSLVAPLGPGALGFGVVYSGTDGIELWDPGNNPGDTLTMRSGYAIAGYGISLTSGLCVGLALKGLLDELSEHTGVGFCSDFGVHYRLTHRLQVGGALQNIGPAMRYGSDAYPLPALLRVGAAYAGPRFSLLLDGNLSRDNYPSLHFGGEYEANRLLALRGGLRLGPHDWRTLRWTSLFTAGAGVNLGRLHLDYALVPYGPLGLTHRIGVRLDFAPSRFGRVRIRTSEFGTGSPLAARFTLSGVQYGESVTEPDGTFALTDVETGWLHVVAQTDEHDPIADSIFVEPRATHNVTLVLLRAGHGSLWGAVYDAVTHRTLRTKVSYTGPADGELENDPEQGSFVLRHLPAGPYRFTVTALENNYEALTEEIVIEPERLTSHSFMLSPLGYEPVATDTAPPVPAPDEDAPDETAAPE